MHNEDDIFETRDEYACTGARRNRCDSETECGCLAHNTKVCGHFIACIEGSNDGCTEQKECGNSCATTQTRVVRSVREADPTAVLPCEGAPALPY